MHLRFKFCATLLGLAMAGCGSKGVVTPPEPTVKEFLGDFEMALMDARGTLESVQASAGKPRSNNDEEEEDKPEDQIRSVLQMVSSAAQQLAKSAAGHATESDMKAIATEAQELVKKNMGRSSPADALQGVKQLSSKAEALKAKL